jgi:hypothetical protein
VVEFGSVDQAGEAMTINNNNANGETMSQPISPKDLTTTIPDFVVEAVNTLLTKHYKPRGTTIKQEDIIQEILKAKPDLDRQAIFDNDYLDFEAAYEAKGWRVTYDKPGYNETYPASFLFVGKP